MAIYDRIANIYDGFMFPLEKLGLGRYRDEIFSRLPRSGTLLEIGCGTGANRRHHPKDARVIASEYSFEMIRRAKAKDRVQCSAMSLPFTASSFDAAFASLVFCSIPAPELAFAEIRRVLKDNGKLFLLEHVRPPGILGQAFSALNPLTVALIDDHIDRETASIAGSSGFRILDRTPKMKGVIELIELDADPNFF